MERNETERERVYNYSLLPVGARSAPRGGGGGKGVSSSEKREMLRGVEREKTEEKGAAQGERKGGGTVSEARGEDVQQRPEMWVFLGSVVCV